MLIILVLLNILVAFKYVQSVKKTEALTSLALVYENNERDKDYKNNIIKKLKYSFTDSKLKLISIITEGGCGSCVENEIKYLNKLYLKNKNYVEVFYVGNNKGILSALGAKFKFNMIHDNHMVVNMDLMTSQPIALLADSNKNVFMINLSSVNAPAKTQKFYADVLSLLNLVYEK